MVKFYGQAPLPFMGQKRRFLTAFKKALNAFENRSVFVDLFGGSGLLSHTIRQARPDAAVIYNDYDDYSSRLRGIPSTNALLARIRAITDPLPRGVAIKGYPRDEVLRIVHAADQAGRVDYITLSASLLFSMNYVADFESLAKQTLYNTVRCNDYSADGYLDGVTVVREDYGSLFERWRWSPNVVFLVDPPYLSTEVGVYKSRWRLNEYLNVLRTVRDTSYFYFTSNKSQLIELCDWMETDAGVVNPFAGATRIDIESSTGHNSGYTDIMLYLNRSGVRDHDHG